MSYLGLAYAAAVLFGEDRCLTSTWTNHRPLAHPLVLIPLVVALGLPVVLALLRAAGLY
jgi:hypothetical protein